MTWHFDAVDKKPLEEIFRLDDTRKGHDSLRRILENSNYEHELEQIFCAVESTGGFENNWYATIISSSEQLPVKVARLNPLGVKHNAEAELSRNVTDALSSKYIAEYLICHSAKVDYTEQDTYYASFRSLHKHILMLKKQNNQLVNELKMVLYSSFPEMLRIVHGILSSGIPYDAKVDNDNQEKQIAGTGEEDYARNLKSVRRFQPEDIDAPISRIEKKKRRVFAESQFCATEHEQNYTPAPVTTL
ncbi:MAG: IS110 family transposase [Flavobacteriales bacterium]|nr:IS110 family transposase [Flavobacteriales bacterium]